MDSNTTINYDEVVLNLPVSASLRNIHVQNIPNAIEIDDFLGGCVISELELAGIGDTILSCDDKAMPSEIDFQKYLIKANYIFFKTTPILEQKSSKFC